MPQTRKNPSEEDGPPDFWKLMDTVPARMTVLAAAAAAVVAFLPQAAIPEPLNALREFGVAFVMVALLLAWALRGWLRTHVRGVVAATAALLVTLILVHQLFVKPVRYHTEDGAGPRTETVWFITGWAVADPAMQEKTAEDLIRDAGDGWDELRAIWGGSFVSMAIVYYGLYLLVITGFILSLRGADVIPLEPATAAPQPLQAGAPGKRKRRRSRV